MSRRSVILALFPLTVIFFVAGWLSYDWAFDYVTAKIARPIIFASVQEAFKHQLMTSLSFALMGTITGFGALLGGRFSARRRYGHVLSVLLLVATLAVSGWIVVLARRMVTLGEHIGGVPGLPEVSLPLSAIRLYEIGLFGSGCVLTAAIILALFRVSK